MKGEETLSYLDGGATPLLPEDCPGKLDPTHRVEQSSADPISFLHRSMHGNDGETGQTEASGEQ